MLENLKGKERCLINSLLVILGIFLISLIVLKVLDIKDKIQLTEKTISVSATGEVYAKPDLAIINFSVVTEKKTVDEALSENATKMNAVVNAIKERGIEDKDLKTTSFNIYPRYEWYGKSEIYPTGKRVLVGYEVVQTLEVKIREMKKIGEIIEVATEAGANEVSNLQLTIENQDELKKQARKQAIEKTKDKAKELASQLGVKLGKITSFNESSETPYYYPLKFAEMAAPAAGETPQIETGQNKISVTVTITYEIR